MFTEIMTKASLVSTIVLDMFIEVSPVLERKLVPSILSVDFCNVVLFWSK